ncbi:MULTISPECIES: MogA/MoaB family molybdenum cofactor biosynthesis protein [unclassified Corynebacterium]|uniref:MogA/MoaB family molybdenum cofactor biosynthesis protein n=1 Tax=unclassified Corynebacterium TaxID=2624378 RepID=UPI002A90EDDB|nr:MogA/MoaB family molybdenum cofactor biosynthesis protein [Corynebacterium sp.]MDY5786250.1 MogA/MoaB family molybdenum cofactor biosynthesis protein [Corynebacterium sp.]
MRNAVVIVASTRAAAGEYEDRSGPVAVEFLRSQGFDTPDATVVADAELAPAVHAALADSPTVLLTSGGTGITPDDYTVEVVEPLLDKQLPGIVHAFWENGRAVTPTAILSRAVAGISGTTFVMTLPGSRGGVADGCAVLEPVLGHIVALMEGNRDHA